MNTEIREALQKLESISYFIERLSDAFYKTGNEKVGSELECYSDDIILSVNEIDSILKDDIDKRYQEAIKNTSRMMGRLLDRARNDK